MATNAPGHVVRKTIVINAKPAEVWDALTNPDKTKQYFFHCEVFSEWRVGSSITFKGKIFFVKKIEMTGTITQIEPEKLLQYTLVNAADGDAPATTSTVTDELVFKNGATTLSITDDVGAGEGAEERYAQSDKGWDKVLKGLKELVEEAEGTRDSDA